MKLERPLSARDSVETADDGHDGALRVLVPDLPAVDDYIASLRKIDAARWYTNGGVLSVAFEAALQALVTEQSGEEQHCVTTSSGTAALEVSLACLDLPRGARVLVPAYTFPATANAVIRAGHAPVIGDVCTKRWTLTPAMAHAALGRQRIEAIIPVAVFGTGVPVEEWDAFVDATGVPVIIDAAAALGNLGGGKRVVVAYSLHATKPLGIGEGGVIASADPAFASRVRRTINHGFESGTVTLAGTNARLSEYGAAIGLAQLSRRMGVLRRRRALWHRYRELLSRLPAVALQHEPDDEPPAVLTIETAVAAEVVAAALARERIETRRWYAPPLHAHAAFMGMPRDPLHSSSLPVAERLGRHAIGVPFHTRLSDADVDRVVDALASALHAAPGVQDGSAQRPQWPRSAPTHRVR